MVSGKTVVVSIRLLLVLGNSMSRADFFVVLLARQLWEFVPQLSAKYHFVRALASARVWYCAVVTHERE